MKIAPAGDRGVLIDLGDVSASELHEAARAKRAEPGIAAVIIGQSSLYVIEGETGRSAAAVPAPSSHVVPVSFHGPDLPEFLRHHRLEKDAFLDRVASLRLIVRFIGFRGGFGYLDGWPKEWSMPRRPTSRPRVEPGTFAIAGAVAAFYPIASPGGWNLLGRTSADLAFKLAPSDTIVIEPTLLPLPGPAQPDGESVSAPVPPFPLQLIHSPLSQLVTAPDWTNTLHGRPPGGPFDDEAARFANRAVGNDPNAPILESALAGPHAVATRSLVCSWFGAGVEIMVNGSLIADPRQFSVASGDEIRAGRLRNGLRGYLAAGEKRGPVESLEREDRLTIHAIAGPHDSPLRTMTCEVTSELDRVGIRMRLVEPAAVAAPATLPSCGVQCGTIQLHPDGSVVAMGPDHPVTGGYLQPMTVMSSQRWKLAQLAPGDRAVFTAQPLSP